MFSFSVRGAQALTTCGWAGNNSYKYSSPHAVACSCCDLTCGASGRRPQVEENWTRKRERNSSKEKEPECASLHRFSLLALLAPLFILGVGLCVKVGVSSWVSCSLCASRVATTSLFATYSCWINQNSLFWTWRTQLFGVLTAAGMSEEAKEKSTGRSAHRKKKGKKVKDAQSFVNNMV